MLFGLIMVLTFTGSLSIAEAGRDDVRAMLIGALGCNIAWGIIDGILYLMGSLAEKGRNLAAYRAVVQAATPREAERLIADALPPVFVEVLNLPAVKETLTKQGVEVMATTRAETADFIAREMKRYAEVVAFSGAKVD